jgi:hypothetical protein
MGIGNGNPQNTQVMEAFRYSIILRFAIIKLDLIYKAVPYSRPGRRIQNLGIVWSLLGSESFALRWPIRIQRTLILRISAKILISGWFLLVN